MKPFSCNREMGDTERLLCPGAPQGPARFQSEYGQGSELRLGKQALWCRALQATRRGP